MTTNQLDKEAVLWKNWLENKNTDAVNQLLEHYMYLVQFHVERTASHLPASVSKEDLKSYGMLGLYDAIKKFDQKRNLKFDTYASFRVRGAIIDGLRKEDWLPRSIREKGKKVEKASRILEQQLQREPNAKEIAAYLGISSEEVESIVKDSLFSNVLSIEEKTKENNHAMKDGTGYDIKDQQVILPDEHIIADELKEDLAAAINALTKNEQLIISLFYHDELTLTEIGHVMGLTTSRISQIHKKAIFKLRKTMEKLAINM
ncbi:FliA/WhiG family RNA polymerase sigma factor [Virgibacillus sp. 179-BFC.A HS]|uniref:FliA/WhiG family RNA polymerase sigma factor n=1 Tax=Tigheibacillus jepli TaxID=3035914 RepID=A0ABU5CK43_9BACI|nr:FliA/WhiG family RNA polymerase sigma factor [Virgibacillus sp. 179-BFC.A HS]MDY0405865.1 FliA/WhiG family RNA polymerase sigma factor [Virgibacillus sp. 179-BFC.A HS]